MEQDQQQTTAEQHIIEQLALGKANLEVAVLRLQHENQQLRAALGEQGSPEGTDLP